MDDQVYVWVGTINPWIIFFIILLITTIIFIPSLIAFSRMHCSRVGILLLNIFLGWTIVGWIILLVWSLSEHSRQMRLKV